MRRCRCIGRKAQWQTPFFVLNSKLSIYSKGHLETSHHKEHKHIQKWYVHLYSILLREGRKNSVISTTKITFVHLYCWQRLGEKLEFV